MRRAIFLTAAIAIAAVVMTAASASGRGAKTVEVGDDFFDPASMTVKERTTIRFEWIGVGEHNVYKKSGPGRVFDSDPHVGEGFVYSRKFKKPGRYVLGCILHEDMLMDLRVKKRRR